MSESDSVIVLFPDFDKLQKEVEKLKTELSMLLLERDELVYVVCKNIQTAYMLRLGGLEYNAFKAQCTAQRLKRKIELIQARKNRQEAVNFDELERILDREFAEYEKKLEEQIKRMNDALEWSRERELTEAETKELKKLYRAIVKALHPDVTPNATPEQIRLLENATEAYKNGDLAALRVIYEMISNIPAQESGTDALLHLTERKKRLLASIQSVRERIQKIKSEYPYTMKEIVSDEEKLRQRKAELEQILRQYEEWIEYYRKRLDEMLKQES